MLFTKWDMKAALQTERAEGYAEGQAEVREEERIRIIKRMLAQNIAIEEIVEIMECPVDLVQKCAKELKKNG